MNQFPFLIRVFRVDSWLNDLVVKQSNLFQSEVAHEAGYQSYREWCLSYR